MTGFFILYDLFYARSDLSLIRRTESRTKMAAYTLTTLDLELEKGRSVRVHLSDTTPHLKA
jgi:hypothetical protein